MNKIPENLNAPVIEICQLELECLSENSIYKTICPVCKKGLLLINRDQESLELMEYDRCVLCGQQVRYLDIEILRKRERGK